MKIGNGGSRRMGRTHQVMPDVPYSKLVFAEEEDTCLASIEIGLETSSLKASSLDKSMALPMDVLFSGDEALSGGPSVEMRKQCRFSDIISIGETWSSREYERGSLAPAPLTPLLAYLIRIELNEVKAQMDIHQDSRHYTQFFPT